MKPWTFALVAGVCTAFATSSAHAARLNPQIAVNASQYADQTSTSLEDEARAGIGIGGFVRLGEGQFFFQPGFFYQQNTVDLFGIDATLQEIEEELVVTSLFVPAMLEFSILDAGIVGFRGGAGAAATFVTSVKDNSLGLTRDDYEDIVWGAVFGLGADIGMITADLSFELGMSGVYAQDQPGVVVETTKQNVWRLAAGLLF